MPYTYAMRTVAETEVFQRYASLVWTSEDLGQFINWIAANPEAGAVIPGSGGCRKVRWTTPGTGKRGGARVIYFLHRNETIWLLIVYRKAQFDVLPTSFLAQLKMAIENEV
jgi:hypothetical protein